MYARRIEVALRLRNLLIVIVALRAQAINHESRLCRVVLVTYCAVSDNVA